MLSDCDFLIDLMSIDDPYAQQFFSERGRQIAVNYLKKHNITRPPKDEAEALQWAQEATDEYINGL